MKMPEGYLPRKGDLLTVTAKVSFDVDGIDPYVHTKVGTTSVMIKLADVAGIHTLRWGVDDEVFLFPNLKERATVIATHDDMVWVNFANGPRVLHANQLRLWKEPEAEPVAPVEEPNPAEATVSYITPQPPMPWESRS